MPKRSSTARGTAQRQRPKAQRNIAFVRPVTDESEPQSEEREQLPVTSTATATAVTEQTLAKTDTEPPKASSASARLAARRRGVQRTQQRNAANLLTPEHFAYVRKDLIFIAILAVVMVAAIITLYFVLGATA